MEIQTHATCDAWRPAATIPVFSRLGRRRDGRHKPDRDN
jgi:hypothetical protein